MNWIDNIISKSKAVIPTCDEEQTLIDELVSIAFSKQMKTTDRGLLLASFYDLVVSAVYYTYITNSGWMYCKNNGVPKLTLPFVNCCPIHVLSNEFVFHKSNKPTSAKIGEATSRILLLFFQSLFKEFGKHIKVLDACEPADAIFIDETNKCAFFAEIKASPLLTMSLAMNCDMMTDTNDDGNLVDIEHKSTANPNLLGKELFIMLPAKTNDNSWKMTYHSIGKKTTATDVSFAYKGLRNLIKDPEFIKCYNDYWLSSFNLYCKKDDEQSIFWFTNACGKPSNLPKSWEGGTTCISDAKTSVGMDRTDDIKKGIYQVLKLGSEGKQHDFGWNYKVGIISNIHPARHFGTYIKPIKDLIWTTSVEKNVSFAGELPTDKPMYNLFDGIVTFTNCYIRDKWLLDELFSFLRDYDRPVS